MKKKLILALSAVVALTAVSAVACKDDPEPTPQKSEIEQVYDLYVANAEAKNETPLSYEDWMKTVKGEKGDTGDTGRGIDHVTYENGVLTVYYTDGTQEEVNIG